VRRHLFSKQTRVDDEFEGDTILADEKWGCNGFT